MKRWDTHFLVIMKLSKRELQELIRKMVKSRINEAEEEVKEEDPFAADADKAGGEDGKENTKKQKPEEPVGIPIKFNLSGVKRYNKNPFTNNSGVVKSISRDGVVVTVKPDNTDILVNFNDISEQVSRFFKQKQILKEEENEKLIATMDAAMSNAFKSLGKEFKSNQEEIEQEVQSSEKSLNEAVGILAVVGFILALPKVVEMFAKSIGVLISQWKKLVKPNQAKGDEEAFARNIVEFTHKWHKSYIQGLKWVLKMSGIFKKANITDESAQVKTAEALYYTIVAGLAVYSGVGAVSAFKAAAANAGSNFSIGSFEAAMAAIKSSEVKNFLVKLGLKV